MSVVKSKQRTSELQVLNKAYDILDYTYGITDRNRSTYDIFGNKIKCQVFPKRYWSCFTSKLVECAEGAYFSLFEANNIPLNDTSTLEEFNERKLLQRKAEAKLKTLLAYIDFAWAKFPIAQDSIDFWAGNVRDTLEMAKAWRESDSRRFKRFEAQRQSAKNIFN